jgi:hypothetical protein
MRWWVSDPERWERELHDMDVWFPDWEYFEDVQYGPSREPFLICVWEGELQPLPDDGDEATKILADLNHDRTLLVDRGGVLLHPQGCTGSHEVPDPLRGRSDYGVKFRLRAEHLPPPAHPKVYGLRPYLGPELYYTQGHVNLDCSLCPYTITDDDWNGERDTIARYLRHGVSILLAKHLYWQWTREATGTGVWPGKKGPHGLSEAIIEAQKRPPTVQCRCGSGRAYRNCHMEEDNHTMRTHLLGSAGPGVRPRFQPP